MTTVEHGFKMEAIREALDLEDWEEDDMNPGSEVRRVYLGSVFALAPSGKYYMPWACGNLDSCPKCKGKGSLPSPKGAVDCEECGGCGSHEAYRDELWREATEEAFSAMGLSFEAGEGDPCDLFAAEYRDAERYECADCGAGDHPTSECPNPPTPDDP